MLNLPPVPSIAVSLNRRRLTICAGVIVLGMGILWGWHAMRMGAALTAVARWAHQGGSTGYILFGSVYLLAVVIGLPTSVLTALSGFLYGPLLGSAIVLPPSLLGAAISFWLSRTVGRRWAERRLLKHRSVAAVDAALVEHPLTIMTLLRLSPVLPSNLLNFLFALSGVRFGPYLAASVFSMIPGTLLFAYAGSAVTNVRRLISAKHSQGVSILYWLGLAATTVAVLLVSWLARRALAGRRTERRQIG
jgi:uncharacterized membrane protein YdjX (TVP38/TMEM64 family)